MVHLCQDTGPKTSTPILTMRTFCVDALDASDEFLSTAKPLFRKGRTILKCWNSDPTWCK
jgi:hypothetical protein